VGVWNVMVPVVGTFIGVLITFALPSLILDVVLIGGVPVDTGPADAKFE
jgi:hypothetical protein